MPEYIDLGIESLLDSESDKQVTLLVGASGDQEAVPRRVRESRATVEDTLGQATLPVRAPESQIATLCGFDRLTSIELDQDDVWILDSGNGHSCQRVIVTAVSDYRPYRLLGWKVAT